jgi:hypothetical protein
MLKHLEDSGADTNINDNFVTMDIETILINKIIPYLICAYNGTDYITSFLSSFDGEATACFKCSALELFSNFIKGLLTFFKAKSKTLIVYAHNLSSFDGIFLLEHLLTLGFVIYFGENADSYNLQFCL